MQPPHNTRSTQKKCTFKRARSVTIHHNTIPTPRLPCRPGVVVVVVARSQRSACSRARNTKCVYAHMLTDVTSNQNQSKRPKRIVEQSDHDSNKHITLGWFVPARPWCVFRIRLARSNLFRTTRSKYGECVLIEFKNNNNSNSNNTNVYRKL